MQGCYTVEKNQECPYDIQCNIINKFKKVPEEQQNLYLSIEKVTTVIKSLNVKKKKKKKNEENEIKDEYFNKVFGIAQLGLTGDNAQPILGMRALDSLQEEMLINESGRIKNKYMTLLGFCALGFIIFGVILILLLKWLKLNSLLRYILVFQGAMIGSWVSFGARKIELKFEELSNIEKDKLNPIIRLLFVGVSACILLLFIESGIITFSIGGFDSNNIIDSRKLQLLLGIIAGLLEYKVAIGVLDKANSII